MSFLNNIDATLAYNKPDIAEELSDGFFLGYFEPGTNGDAGEQNCMIVRMLRVGSITKMLFAEGINYKNCLTWANRNNYEYKYKEKQI